MKILKFIKQLSFVGKWGCQVFLEIRFVAEFPSLLCVQNVLFLQVWTCQNAQKSTWNKISHFDRSGAVEISKKVLAAKFLILTGPDLLKFPKKYLEQNFSNFYRSGPVKFSKRVLGAKFLIFTGPDLSKFPKKYFEQNLSFLQVWTCQNFQKSTWSKISHFYRSGPVKIS